MHGHSISEGSVYIDKDQQQEVKYDTDDSQHSQESLLWCAQVWTLQVHVKPFQEIYELIKVVFCQMLMKYLCVHVNVLFK